MTRTLLASCAIAALALVPAARAHTATETLLHSFCTQANCTDGATSFATLVADSSGNLYGTTYEGGANNDGEIFEFAPNGTFTVLHSFAGQDGALPHAGVIMDAGGNLYGTTAEGGNKRGNCGKAGCGTVFRLAPDGTLSVVYAFNKTDGAEPLAALLMDGSGNVYGTTAEASGGYGTVFEIAADGTQKTLLYFGGADGAAPRASLVMDSSGNLYGTAAEGGNLTNCTLGCGTIFEITSSGKEKTLHAFHGGDGATPMAGLTLSGHALFGVAAFDGSHGDGNVFKWSTHGFRELHQFGGKGDAQLPLAALAPDGNGGFFGTACDGGANKAGAVFDVSAQGTETVVYSFTGGSDGMCPESSLVNVNGTLYGTTAQGGGTGCSGHDGCGTVFAIKE